MTACLVEPTLRLTALHGWVTPHRYPLGNNPRLLHWAVLAAADEKYQGRAACGKRFNRDDEWWTASQHALESAADHRGIWELCGGCTYWAGGMP